MTWLVPIGLLGLLGVIALIVIYIIKPNYQNKVISSTYVWKLSLKYRKKAIPLSRLNNILLFICQLLILTLCGLLLAQPVIETEKLGDDKEKVIVIDASASMLVTDGNDTRFERAVEEARLLAEDAFRAGGLVSVILADTEPEFIAQRTASENSDELYAALDSLLEGETAVTYSSADLDAAFALSEEVLLYNSETQVYFCTATDYVQKNGINVVDVSVPGTEWNAAVLNCTAELDGENHYEISIDLGCYGKTESLSVHCQVYGVNGKSEKSDILVKTESFDPTAEEKTVTFTSDDFGGVHLYSFDYIEVYLSVADSFADDNSYFLYGGKKPVIKVQYASSTPNLYFGGAVRTLRENMKNVWDIEFTELKADEKGATEGFDLYIFEHRMPEVMPTDGVVLLVDPNSAPDNSGLRFGDSYSVSSDSTLAAGVTHELMKYVDCNRLTIAKYRDVLSHDGYEELAYYQGKPMILAKNEENAKVIVWTFDLNYSNLIALPDFAFLVYNMFNYHIPPTLTSNSFEIGDTVALNARGTELKVTGNGQETVFDGNVGEIIATRPGTYTVTQRPMQGDELLIENFFVRIPNYESNITKQVDELPLINIERKVELEYQDLIFYFAIALVAFMFIEWYLQSRKNKLL